MKTSPQAPSAAYQSCVDEVLVQSPFVIGHWCSKLADAMYQRSILIPDAADRYAVQNAIAALKKNRGVIEQRFPDELKKAIADDETAPGTARTAVQSARSLSSVRFDELELMGDDQVQDAVESARFQQLIRLHCEAGLAEFSARLSTAQGFLVVKADSNPLRPEVMAMALFGLLQALPVSSHARACWLLDGARIMGEELQSLYVLLNDLLARQHIAPAAYGVIPTPQGKSERGFSRERMGGFAFSQAFHDPVESRYEKLSPVAEPVPFSSSQLLTLDHLRHLLVGDYDNSSGDSSSFPEDRPDGVVHQDFSHTLPAALDVLSELEEKGFSPMRGKAARFAPSQPVAQMRAHLRTDAKSLGQSLAIEVVGLMIEQMANDERLLQPIRKVIANSEPAFLRLAVTDPRFFSDKGHPARKLLETITSTSLGYASETATGFAEFMQNLQEVALLLTEEHAGDAQHFADLLQDFERRQNRNKPEYRQAQRRAVQALLQAEQRNMMALKIAAEIRLRPDFIEGNRVITAFLTGPWAQVMAKERLLGEYDPSSTTQATFSLTLGDLLWSLDIAQAARHRKRLIKLIPDMLRSLRLGLQSIDYPMPQASAFFDELIAIHQAGLKAQPQTPETDAPRSRTLEKMFVADEESEAAELWLAPTEVQQSGFMQDWDDATDSRPASDLFEPQDHASPPPVVADLALSLGDWIELLVDMQWLRAQLTWVSPQNTLFMFTSEGGRKHSMTSRVLNHRVQLQLVKVVSQQGVVDGALDSVARTAMHNSVQGTGGL